MQNCCDAAPMPRGGLKFFVISNTRRSMGWKYPAQHAHYAVQPQTTVHANTFGYQMRSARPTGSRSENLNCIKARLYWFFYLGNITWIIGRQGKWLGITVSVTKQRSHGKGIVKREQRKSDSTSQYEYYERHSFANWILGRLPTTSVPEKDEWYSETL